VKTVQLTLDEPLVDQVDKAVKELGTSRSAFTREALRAALARRQVQELENQHRKGYEANPVDPTDIEDWEEEQVWPD
jgi:metal-responsive CopG/Arc/MetJ family transcriptional regulator